MDPATIGLVLGAATSLFGGKKATTPAHLKQNYRLSNAILQRAIDLYDGTNFEELDRKALDAYTKTSMDQAFAALNNYDAILSGKGISILKDDTAKNRARTQIAADSTQDVGKMEAGLISTRPNRQAQLLPNTGDAANLAGTAQTLDAFDMNRSAAEQNAMLSLASVVAKLFGKKGAKSGINDVYGAMPQGGILDNSWMNPTDRTMV